jgi:hypothetical protein
VTRATEAIGDPAIQGGLQTAFASSTAGRPHSPRRSYRRRTEKSPILWQAGMLLTVTGTVGSLCNVACAISDRVLAGWIRASPEVVVAPVAVAPSSA